MCGVSFCVAGAVFIGQFRFVIVAFRIGTAARGAMLPSYFVPFWLGRGDVETCHSRLDPPHSTFHTFHYYTDHFTFQATPHSTLHTSHSTIYTAHLTFHIRNPHVHTLQSTLYTPHFTLYTSHSRLYTLHSTLHSLNFTLYTPHFTLYS